MVQLYINMINAGRITLAEIPQPWRDQVAAAMGIAANTEPAIEPEPDTTEPEEPTESPDPDAGDGDPKGGL